MQIARSDVGVEGLTFCASIPENELLVVTDRAKHVRVLIVPRHILHTTRNSISNVCRCSSGRDSKIWGVLRASGALQLVPETLIHKSTACCMRSAASYTA